MASTKRSKARSRSAPKRTTRQTAAKRSKRPAKALTFRSGAPSLTVNDIAKSMAWYCDVLGFSVKQRWEHNGVLLGGELAAGSATVYIGQDDWKKGRDRVKGEGVRLFLYVKSKGDVDRLATAIVARGGILASEPRDEWGARSFSLEDPTGYKITVSSEM